MNSTRYGKHAALAGIALLLGSVAARAYDTTWISSGEAISASKLKADLDEAQARLTALEANRVQRAFIGADGVVSSQSGTWLATVSHPGMGTYNLTFTAGTFSATPTCVATPNSGNQTPPAIECYDIGAAGMTCLQITGTAATDSAWMLICSGPS